MHRAKINEQNSHIDGLVFYGVVWIISVDKVSTVVKRGVVSLILLKITTSFHVWLEEIPFKSKY